MSADADRSKLIVHMDSRHPDHAKALHAIFRLVPGEFSGWTTNTVVLPGTPGGRFHEIAEELLVSMSGDEVAARLRGASLTQVEIAVETARVGEFLDRLAAHDDLRTVLLDTPEFESVNSPEIVAALSATLAPRP